MTGVLTRSRSDLGLAALPAAVQPVLEAVGERAGEVDRGTADLWDGLRDLGAQGLLDAPLPVALELAHALARRCTPTAFSYWAHRSTIAFHDATGVSCPEGAATGSVALASGMAPAFKEEAGLGEVSLAASEHPEGGLSVSGVLPWCSNLRPGAWIVTPVRLAGGEDADGGHGPRAVVRISRDAEGVTVKPLTGLTSMDGTSSGVLILDGVRIPGSDVISRDLVGFRGRIRAPFLLIQTAMCLGLAGAALDAAAVAADDTSRRVLAEEFDRSAADWESLRSELVRLAGSAEEPAPRELVAVRLAAAQLAGATAGLEQKVAGGRGFALASGTSRRVREAAFLPVQSPTEIHLRHLLDRAVPDRLEHVPGSRT